MANNSLSTDNKGCKRALSKLYYKCEKWMEASLPPKLAIGSALSCDSKGCKTILLLDTELLQACQSIVYIISVKGGWRLHFPNNWNG